MNRKQIRVTLTLGEKDEVFTSNENKLVADGLRVLVDISSGNGAVLPIAYIRIFGLRLENMNKLLRVRWNTMGALLNKVKIEAGEEGQDFHTVFEGNITFCYPDFASAPDVALIIEAQSGALENLRAAKPKEYRGRIDVAKIIEDIAKDMGYGFQNDGFSKIVENITVNDTNVARLRALEHAYEFKSYLENNTIIITPKDLARKIKIPVVSPTTGLIGYPVPSIKGVEFKCLYDPLIRFGGLVRIKDSLVDSCNGDWRIYGLRQVLEANQPNGAWFCEVSATFRDSKDAAIKK